jgi:hypothetical protein
MTGDVIPSVARNPVWMLHFVQHDRLGMANLTLLSLSFKKERDVSASPKQGEVNPARECFTALTLAFSMTGWKWRTSPSCPSPLKGEGRFGIAETG